MSWKLVGLAVLGYLGYKWYEKKHPAVTLAGAPGTLQAYTVHDPNGQQVLVSTLDPSAGSGSPGTVAAVSDGTLAQATTKPVTLSADGNLALVTLAPAPIGTTPWPLQGYIPIAELKAAS